MNVADCKVYPGDSTWLGAIWLLNVDIYHLRAHSAYMGGHAYECISGQRGQGVHMQSEGVLMLLSLTCA